MATGSPRRRAFAVACVVGALCGLRPGFAQDATGSAEGSANQRPDIDFYRWREDWSVLADPSLRTEPGDSLKYVSLSPSDPKRYLSFGITLRERLERNDAPLFGAGGTPPDTYLLHRLELHADAHLTDRTRVFLQLENALAPGRVHPLPADANRADLRLAFVDTTDTLGDGIYTIRIGRQEIAFDLQRFASVRDGANVRQAFDALWARYERGNWRLSALYSWPVLYRNERAFDDYSTRHFTFGGVRAHWLISDDAGVSTTLSEYRRDNAHFLGGSGDERRHSLDLHYNGAANGFDWDIEGIAQYGSIGAKSVRAWAAGSLLGYTFVTSAWKPRLGLQLDAASGDRNLSDQQIGTFNPLFPNGAYINLSGYTAYINFIHFKQSLTLVPTPRVKVLAAVGELWRQTTGDAVYARPAPIPNTAGEPGRYTGTYFQVRFDWFVSRSFALALEANHYVVAPVIRNAGGHNSTYLGLEARWGW